MSVEARELESVTYDAASALRRPRRLVRAWMRELPLAARIGWQLLVRNVRAQYRQSLLGYVWALLPALATSGVWAGLRGHQVVTFDAPDVPYFAFVLSGMVFWQLFVDALQAPLRSVTGAAPLLVKVSFPRDALLVAGLGDVLFSFAVRLVALIAVLAAMGFSWHASLALVPFGALALVVLGTSLGLWLVPLGVLYQDIGRGLGLVTQFWLYLTPVVYAAPVAWPASLINTLNPVSSLLVASRGWVLGLPVDLDLPFAAHLTLAGALLLGGLVVYRVAMPRLIERMGA